MSKDFKSHIEATGIFYPGIKMLDLTNIDSSNICNSQVARIEDDFIIARGVKMNHIFNSPYRLNAMIIAICTKGNTTVKFNLNEYELSEGTFFVNSPEKIVQIKEDPSVVLDIIVISINFIKEIKIDIKNLIPIKLHMSENPCIQLENDEMELFERQIELIYDIITHNGVYIKEITRRLAAAMVYSVINIIDKRLSDKDIRVCDVSVKMGTVVFEKFIELLKQHYLQERSVSFYANKLNLTPKYLSGLIKKMSGQTVAKWIDDYVILEAKILLKFSNKSIQEISYYLNFSSQSFFGKYFKHIVGMSPGQYKKNSN
ncbi:MAG: AraC family transcriptional regulator [Bacteroidales bacterium]